MRNTDENIRKILEKINNTPTPLASADGELEIEFSDTEGLVFFEGEPPAKEEKRSIEAPKPLSSPLDISEEFSLPESFEVNEKYDTPETPDVTSRIWTTYVPRFTEVSENYRMADDLRPRTLPMGEKLPPRIERIEEPTATAADADTLDPTAEIDSIEVDAVIARRYNPTPDENSETLSIFKFADEEREPVPEKSEEELEREAILRLIPTAAVEEAAEPEEEPVVEEEPEEHEFVMADPDTALAEITVDAPAAERIAVPAPDGVEEGDGERRRRGEFTHQTQRELFKDVFLDSLMSVRVRMISTVILAAIMLVFENLWVFGIRVDSLLNLEMLPGALAIIDALFVGCIFLLSIPETVRALRALLRGKALPELVLPLGLAVIVAYAVVLTIFPVVDYALFGFIYAALSASAIAASHFRTSADFVAFKLSSKNSEKRILDNKLTRMLPEENIALDGAVDEYRSRTARIFRAAFITDFYKRISKGSERSASTVIALSISLGAALVMAAASFFLPGGGAVAAVSALALVFLLGSPAALLLSHKLPYFYAQREAQSEDSTVIGEATFLEYSDVDVIAFEDTEIFGTDDVNLKRFMLYGERDNMEKVMRQMSSLFAAVGGPLEYIFQSALDKRSHPAAAVLVESDGISGEVDGVRIYAGTEDYMLRHDVKIPDGAARPEPHGTGTTKIMYAAEAGEVYAKFYIRYSFSEEFTMLLPELRKKGIVPLIYTRDPNVSNELLLLLTAGQDSIRVVKRLAPGNDETPIFRRVSAGVVTYGNKINAINIILLTKRYKSFLNTVTKLEYYAVGAGTLVGAVLSLVLSSPIPSALAALWQIALSAALGIASKKIFRKDR